MEGTGVNWVSVNDSAFGGWSGDIWRRVDFVNPDVGYFFESGSNPQYLYKTIDGGINWDALPYPANYIMVLKFYDENIGYTNDWNVSHYTFDGGMTWTELSTPPDGWGMDIEYCPGDPSKVWLCRQGSSNIFFSNDSGKTWNEQAGIVAPRDIVMVDSANGWILGDVGVYNTTSGGHILDVNDTKIPLITEFTVAGNYPNPFNPTTTIQYELPQRSAVQIAIYDLLGREVITLVSEIQDAGYQSVQWNASNVPSGMYFYQIRVGDQVQTKKLLLLK